MKRRARGGPGPFAVERREIDEFVERLVSTAEAFLAVVELGGRQVSHPSRQAV